MVPDRFDDPGAAYGYHRTLFDQVANRERPSTISITPSSRHLGVTVRDTRRPGFEEAVQTAYEEDYPVLIRSAGGGQPQQASVLSASLSSALLVRKKGGGG